MSFKKRTINMVLNRQIGFLIIGLALLLGNVKAEDWPNWRGPDRNGISRETEWNALALEGNTVGPIVLASCAAVLDGAVLGDHASPISDTTILSALGSTVDVVLHVNTQLPYVITVGVIAIACGSVPAGLGLPVGFSILAGCLASIAAVFVMGRSTDPAVRSPQPGRTPQP